jgi:hypothetical protein
MSASLDVSTNSNAPAIVAVIFVSKYNISSKEDMKQKQLLITRIELVPLVKENRDILD